MNSTKYDLFICYRGGEGGVLAASIYNEIVLHSKGKINPFFAPRCIKHGDNFKTQCLDVVGKVPLVILILSPDFFAGCKDDDDIVYGELKSAMANEKAEFLPIVLHGFDFKSQNLSDLFNESEIGRIKHVSALQFNDVYSFSTCDMVMPILKEKIGFHSTDISESIAKSLEGKEVKRQHIANPNKAGYFSQSNTSEIKRLNAQQQLLLNYDMDVYEKYLKGKSGLKVLDIGCSNGEALMARLGKRDEVDTIIGVEFDEGAVEKAKEVYVDTKAKFYVVDLEADDFDKKMKEIMDANGIEKFDWINVLAVVSHLKKPYRVFKALKKICKKGGIFFVRNIDDGINIAYPDKENRFKRAFNILSKCDTVGYRYSGRELFSIFKTLKFKEISLEKFGLNNINMDYDDKSAFFDVIFGFIKNGIKNAVKKHPDNEELIVEHEWFMDNLDELEEQFLAIETFVNFGFLTYVAIVD